MNKPVNPNEMSLTELKAFTFDYQNEVNAMNKNLQGLYELINKKSKEEVKEEVKKVEKK